MYGYILCNNKQELNLSATGAVCEMHENYFLRSLTDLKSPALLHRGLVWGINMQVYCKECGNGIISVGS